MAIINICVNQTKYNNSTRTGEQANIQCTTDLALLLEGARDGVGARHVQALQLPCLFFNFFLGGRERVVGGEFLTRT